MTRRRSIGLAALVLVVILGSLVGIKACQISKLIAFGGTMKRRGPAPEAVGTVIARAASWPIHLDSVGTVSGVESVAVSNDMPGIVVRTGFESGAHVQRGHALVEIDASVERAQLASAQARRDLAQLTAQRNRTMFSQRAIAKSELDNAETLLAAADSEVAGLKAQIEHKIVRAPFAGRAGIRAVKVGQYLPAGTTITTVDSIGEVWVDFTLPQEHLPEVHVGTAVTVAVRGSQPEAGTISAIDPAIDPETRNIKLRATLEDKKTALRSGMFVAVTVELPAQTAVVIVPATAVVHAPFGDSAYVVEAKPPGTPGMTATPDGKPVEIARQQLVRIGEARGDYVAIQEGLRAGQQVVAYGAFKLRNGSPITIDNTIHPEPQLEPHPENR